jgi:hypothetical protein
MQINYLNKNDTNKNFKNNAKLLKFIKILLFTFLVLALFSLNYTLYINGKDYYKIFKLPFFYKDYTLDSVLFALSYIFLYIFCILSFKMKTTKKRMIFLFSIILLNIIFYLFLYLHFNVIILLVISTTNLVLCDIMLSNISAINLLYKYTFLIFFIFQLFKFFVTYSIFLLN